MAKSRFWLQVREEILDESVGDKGGELVWDDIIDLTGSKESVLAMMQSIINTWGGTQKGQPEPFAKADDPSLEELLQNPLAKSFAESVFGSDFIGNLIKMENFTKQRENPIQS